LIDSFMYSVYFLSLISLRILVFSLFYHLFHHHQI
jgi:hypothetical protein